MTIKPANWKSFFLDHENATGVHSQVDLQAIRELTGGDENEGPEPEWYRMSRETDLLYLFFGSDRQVQVLHHVDLLGNRKTSGFTPVGLIGLKTPGQVIKFSLQDFVTFHARVPAWRNFEDALVDLEHFQKLTLEPTAAEDVPVAALIENGATKREKKRIPLLVGNIGHQTFGKDDNELILFDAKGHQNLARASKEILAGKLIEEIAHRL
jgi:hypothetical protein